MSYMGCYTLEPLGICSVVPLRLKRMGGAGVCIEEKKGNVWLEYGTSSSGSVANATRARGLCSEEKKHTKESYTKDFPQNGISKVIKNA
eukprot:424344-Amphidinium_carterae.1